MDLSDSLEDMIHAGITSFKIEGRLKDADYVKNITAYYRKKLDAILEGNSNYIKNPHRVKRHFSFEPNPEKMFSTQFDRLFFFMIVIGNYSARNS